MHKDCTWAWIVALQGTTSPFGSDQLPEDKLVGRTVSKAFRVAAIPTRWSENYSANIWGNDIVFPGVKGIELATKMESDSGEPDDLSRIWTKEVNVVVEAENGFKGIKKVNQQTAYGQGVWRDVVGLYDQGINSAKDKAPNDISVMTLVQGHLFKDERTGAIDIPIVNSGFSRAYWVFKRNGKWNYIVTNEPSDVSGSDNPPGYRAGDGVAVTKRWEL